MISFNICYLMQLVSSLALTYEQYKYWNYYHLNPPVFDLVMVGEDVEPPLLLN